MKPDRSRLLFPLVLTLAMIAGCAASGGAGEDSARFGNLLVIGIAGNYDARAQFERTVVSELRAAGVAARPFYLIAGNKKPQTRDDVLAAVDEYQFDAVVVTRVLDRDADIEMRSGMTGAKISQKDAGFLRRFRYDYEELDEPVSISIDMSVTFRTELYDAASQDLVWSSETKGPDSEIVAEIIDETAKSVVRQLQRAGKLAN